MKKKILILWLALLILFNTNALAMAGEVSVIVQGKSLVTDPAAYIYNGRIMIPLRAVSEHLGGQVAWEALTKTVNIWTDGGLSQIVLTIGKPEAIIAKANMDRQVILDVPAQIYDGRTFVPLRFVADALGQKNIVWEEKTKTAYIDIFKPEPGTKSETVAIGGTNVEINVPLSWSLEKPTKGQSMAFAVTHPSGARLVFKVVEMPAESLSATIANNGQLLGQPPASKTFVVPLAGATGLTGIGTITLPDSLTETEKRILGKQAETIIIHD